VGPEAERRFGRRHFMDLTAVFTAPPEFTVFHGRAEIGRTDPAVLTSASPGQRLLLLAGRTWQVDWIDWRRRRCFVLPVEGTGGEARWASSASGGVSYALARAMRDVVLGEDPPVRLTRRAVAVLSRLRDERDGTVHGDGTGIAREDDDLRWWTWAGHRANATLKSSLGPLADPLQRGDDLYIRLRADMKPGMWRHAIQGLDTRLRLPEADDKALRGLKFTEVLP